VVDPVVIMCVMGDVMVMVLIVVIVGKETTTIERRT
jgi:hypothetical protein